MRIQLGFDLHFEHIDGVFPRDCPLSPADDHGIGDALGDDISGCPSERFSHLTPTDEVLDTSAHGVLENRHTVLQRICEQP